MFRFAQMESDVEFQLHFLDCQPNSILHALTSDEIFSNLYRAATTRILRDEPNPSDRVTDIDQLILRDPLLTFPLQNQTKEIPIEIVKTKHVPRPISPKIVEQVSEIPPAPPFPFTFDPPQPTQCRTPEQESLWATVRNRTKYVVLVTQVFFLLSDRKPERYKIRRPMEFVIKQTYAMKSK